jgi:hypothetical protein
MPRLCWLGVGLHLKRIGKQLSVFLPPAYYTPRPSTRTVGFDERRRAADNAGEMSNLQGCELFMVVRSLELRARPQMVYHTHVRGHSGGLPRYAETGNLTNHIPCTRDSTDLRRVDSL